MKIAARLALPLVLAAALAAAPPTVAAEEATPAILRDAEWRKRFLGSYGFLSGAEPQLQATELELLREVIDLMAVNEETAKLRLQQSSGGDRSAAVDFVLANLQFQTGDIAAAKKTYETAIQKFPDFRRAHKNLGLLYVQEGSFEKALIHLSRAVELGDRDGRNYGLMGYGYLQTGQVLAAEEAYRNAILQEPATRDWRLGLAQSLLELEKYAEAVSIFGTLIEERPDDPKAWLLQANAYIGLDQPLEAAANLEAVRLMGGATKPSLVLLGDIYMNAELPEFASAAYMSVIEGDAGATEFATAKRASQMLARTGAWAEAAKVLSAIDKRYASKLSDGEELEVLTLRAKVARGQGRDAEAARLLESIVKRDGTRGDALLELAAYEQSKGNPDKAILLMERAERVDGFARQALVDHAQLRVQRKEYARAAELLKRALQIRAEPRLERYLARVESAIRP